MPSIEMTETVLQEIKDGKRTKKGTIREKIIFDDKNPDSRSRCEQHHITDINEIMEIKPNAMQREAQKDDIDQAQDFVNMANQVPEEEFALTYTKARQIEHEFAKRVPANVRKEFGNSALQFVKEYADPEKNEKFYELGIKKRPRKLPTAEEMQEAQIAELARKEAEKKWIAEYKANNP